MRRLLHFFPTISHLGGVESILRLHARLDAAQGWTSLVLIACESDAACRVHGASGLGLRGWNDIAALRRRFQRAAVAFQPDIIVFHNLWGARHLLSVALCCHRVGMLHTASDSTLTALVHCRDFLDLVITVSPPMAERARKLVEDRIPVTNLDYPIDPPSVPQRDRPEGAPFVVGFAGRLVVEQKRCDRLVALLDETLKTSPHLRFEIMGTGSYEKTMRLHFADQPAVTFLGRQEGAAYWSRLQQWDAVVLTSDYEGSPLSLVVLEAMSQGVIPVFPAIDSGGDVYIRQIDPTLLYESDDLPAAAAKLRELSQLSPVKIGPLRARAIALTTRFRPEVYARNFFSGLEAGLSTRRPDASRGSLAATDFIPLALLRRYFPELIY